MVVAPTLQLPVAMQLLEAADAMRAEALATMTVSELLSVYRGAALKALQRRVQAMTMRGVRLEERSAVRVLVSLDASHEVGVLQVEAFDRLVTPDQPDPAWSATVRQVWSQLGYAQGRWWVLDQQDLSPDRWVPAP